MAEPAHTDDHDGAGDETPGYVPPAPKALNDMLIQDSDDQSLENYKKALLGDSLGKEALAVPSDPRQVIVTKLAVLVDEHADLELDLTGIITSPSSVHCVLYILPTISKEEIFIY